MKRLALVVLALAAVLVAIPAGAATKTRLAECGDKPLYKPKRVIIACGDGAFRVVKLKWSTWTRNTAVGRGIGKVNTCRPSCAEGKFKSYPVKLTPGKPKSCPTNGRQFTRLTYTFTGKKPAGVKRTDFVDRGCNGATQG
jgi:hypothetical protein